MIKATSFIAVALLLISSGASATECQSSPGHDGKWWSWRIVDSKRCWYQGRPGRSKDLLQWATLHWEWRVSEGDTMVMSGYETSRETAQIEGDTALFYLLRRPL